MKLSVFLILTLTFITPFNIGLSDNAFAKDEVNTPENLFGVTDSFIEGYNIKSELDEYDFFTSFKFNKSKKRYYLQSDTKEGKLFISNYAFPKSKTRLQLFKFYKKQVTQAGFEILLECQKDNKCYDPLLNIKIRMPSGWKPYKIKEKIAKKMIALGAPKQTYAKTESKPEPSTTINGEMALLLVKKPVNDKYVWGIITIRFKKPGSLDNQVFLLALDESAS